VFADRQLELPSTGEILAVERSSASSERVVVCPALDARSGQMAADVLARSDWPVHNRITPMTSTVEALELMRGYCDLFLIAKEEKRENASLIEERIRDLMRKLTTEVPTYEKLLTKKLTPTTVESIQYRAEDAMELYGDADRADREKTAVRLGLADLTLDEYYALADA
jgi:hypothetical protein